MPGLFDHRQFGALMAGPENPPAFPVAYETSGMSLGDWFAGNVAASIMTNAVGIGALPKEERQAWWDKAASASYEIADAMLAEREARIFRDLPPVEEPAPEFPEVFNADLEAAPHDRAVMGQLADGTEKAMLWWHNWPGWRETNAYSSMGEPVTPVAWRPLTKSEFDKYDDIPF